MRQSTGRLERQSAVWSRATPGELSEAFGPWVSLPQGFGGGKRTRLFSPLTDLMALPLSSP
jgi:hypothetical protein